MAHDSVTMFLLLPSPILRQYQHDCLRTTLPGCLAPWRILNIVVEDEYVSLIVAVEKVIWLVGPR